MRAWSFLSLGEEAQFQGNVGYRDRLESSYAWDSTVANHGRVAVGDLALIRDSEYVLGISWIDELGVEEDVEKIRRRCPRCGHTGFKRRRTKSPPFRCPDGHEFERPREEPIRVREFEARYGRSWWAVEGTISVEDLTPAYHSRAQQHSIRELDLQVLRGLVGGTNRGPAPDWWSGGTRRSTTNRTRKAGFRPVTRKERVGQDAYREGLFHRDNSTCAISGPQPASILEAVHWVPYKETGEHRLDWGLLLRRDLHTLVDDRDIAFDPATWKVRVNPAMRGFPEITRWDGGSIRIPRGRIDPSILEEHLARALERWG
jgi:hypothetical protein